jgi:mediator of RNA polymerase II transcription subunit 18
MHELFLTAAIGDEDRQRALQILQGYCAMPPTPLLRRRLYWNGPLVNNRGLDLASLVSQGPRARFWVGLHEQLVRQAYTVLLLYDVKRGQFPKLEALAEEKR